MLSHNSRARARFFDVPDIGHRHQFLRALVALDGSSTTPRGHLVLRSLFLCPGDYGFTLWYNRFRCGRLRKGVGIGGQLRGAPTVSETISRVRSLSMQKRTHARAGWWH